jgi:large subunit ribosomal protein L25
MSNQVSLRAEVRSQLGKGPTNRLRKEGRVPGIMYGYEVQPTSVAVDALELYHALHTAAGTNVLIKLEIDGDDATHLCVARDLDRHAVRGDIVHMDFLAVDKNARIVAEVPVHLADVEDVQKDTGGVVNHVLYTVPILVRPLDTPNYLELSVDGMEIGDVKRIEDLRAHLPEGAEFDIDPERTVVTVNPPDILEEPTEEAIEGEIPEGAEDASEVPASGEGPANESATE